MFASILFPINMHRQTFINNNIRYDLCERLSNQANVTK